jgi:hypothetical protein
VISRWVPSAHPEWGIAAGSLAGHARENKSDDVSAVVRYGVVSTTSELREHGRDDAVA